MTKLTPLSQKVFLFIKDYIDRERFAPSQVEIKEYLNHKTLSAVQDSLKRLEQLKKIERVKGKGRSIRLLY